MKSLLILFATSEQPSNSMAPLQCHTEWTTCDCHKQWPILFRATAGGDATADDHQHSHLQMEARKTPGPSLLGHVRGICDLEHSIRTSHILYNRRLEQINIILLSL